MLLGWISKQVFLPSHSNFLYIKLKLWAMSGILVFLAPLPCCLLQLKEKYRLTISKAAKSPEPTLYSRLAWLMTALSTAQAGSCLGHQTAGGSKPATVPLPTFLCQSLGDWAACYCQACGPRCVSQWLCQGVHCLPGSSDCCPTYSHSPGTIRQPWGWQQAQLQFCPLLAISRQWAPILVASP